MKRGLVSWAPVGVMGVGALFTLGLDLQRPMPLSAPLAGEVPGEIAGYVGQDITLSEGERRVAGMSEYLMRVYEPPAAAAAAGEAEAAGHWFSVYVGYYEQQSQGKTIHSPKNCLPGAGWEVLNSRTGRVESGAGAVTVNRYLLQRGDQRALVLYWYQGRGRVEANEYRVKWDLLRDSALRGRSDEALVRIVVPVVESEEAAFQRAKEVARDVLPAVDRALPGWS